MAKPAKEGPAAQPAAQKERPAKPASKSKPAASTPEKDSGVTLKDLATRLGRDPKSVRSAIRRIKGGAQVGQGGRYRWDSWDDKELKALVSSLTPTPKSAE